MSAPVGDRCLIHSKLPSDFPAQVGNQARFVTAKKKANTPERFASSDLSYQLLVAGTSNKGALAVRGRAIINRHAICASRTVTAHIASVEVRVRRKLGLRSRPANSGAHLRAGSSNRGAQHVPVQPVVGIN